MESPIMGTLDNLLETIAYENYTTNTYLAELLNGDSNGTMSKLITNKNHINNNNINTHKTDVMNQYFCEVINYNNNNSRKSDSEGSQSSENNGKLPHQVTHHYHNSLSMSSYLQMKSFFHLGCLLKFNRISVAFDVFYSINCFLASHFACTCEINKIKKKQNLFIFISSLNRCLVADFFLSLY